MIIENLLRLSLSIIVVQFDLIILIIFLSLSILTIVDILALDERHNLFPVRTDSLIVLIDVFFQTIIKSCFPNINNFIRSSWYEVIPLSTEFSDIRMRFQSIF